MTLDGKPLFTQIKYLKSKGKVCFKFSVNTGNGLEEHDVRLENAHVDFFSAMQRMMGHFGQVMLLPEGYLDDGVVIGVYVRREADGMESVKVAVLRPVQGNREALISSPYAPIGRRSLKNLHELLDEARLCLEGKRATEDLFLSAVDGSEDVALQAKGDLNPN